MTTFFMVLLGLLLLVFGLGLIRLIRGPSLPDRAVALDTMAYAAVGFVGIYGIATDLLVFLDVAIALALVAFLSTVAFAHYILLDVRAGQDEERDDEPG